MPERLRRSELATPASNEHMIQKSAESGADLVFLDLEDAVAPPLKEKARDNAARGLRELDWGNTIRAVRVNSTDTQWAYEDVVHLVEKAGEFIDIIIIPKIKGPRDVWFFDTLLEELELKLKLPHKIGLEALVEETEALARVEEIATCCPRLEALILGFGDFSASQGIRIGPIPDPTLRYPGDLWSYHRNRLICACKAASIDAVDGPFADFKDPEGYRREASWAYQLGAAGKWAIHPSQISIANEVFAPTEEEIAHARKMVEAYEKSAAAGEGAGSADGVLVDAATVRIFQQVLDRAKQTGQI